ncbi:MAG: leucine-rich repeat domain-containing protein [Muribaculaceae bacterium]|nr:leucine-rich repeat domain-containing protein [Muribaculaceae bacterium]
MATVIAALFAAGCSDPQPPQNLEPVIEAMEARNITRTEAALSAHIQLRGTSKLSFVKFHYGVTGNIDRVSQPDDPSALTVTLDLAGLTPGTEYSWYLECGTATATIKSDVKTFTTLPNDPPSVSGLELLASGPTSAIVAFEILDDGGDPVTDAGCEITNNATGDKSRIYVPDGVIIAGAHRLLITGLAMDSRYTIAPFASNNCGCTVGEHIEYATKNSFMLIHPGTLSQLCSGLTGNLDKLSISGSMDGDDFKFLRTILGAPQVGTSEPIDFSVEDVDLFDVNIVRGGGPYDGEHYTVNGQLTTGLFADCAKLRRISLPATATVLARDAFARCEALESLDINTEITEIKPSEGCTALCAINISKGNPHFSSVEGVLFDKEATSILWFPLGKTGDYRLPATVKSIGEGAFYGTKIASLEIPPSVTTIGREAFAGSSLAEITFPDNLANISEGLMQGCVSLVTVRLGSATAYVGNYALAGTSLTNLYVSATIPPFAAPEAFGSIAAGCVLHVPAGCKAVYRNHQRWGQFMRIEEF